MTHADLKDSPYTHLVDARLERLFSAQALRILYPNEVENLHSIIYQHIFHGLNNSVMLCCIRRYRELIEKRREH